MNTWRLRSHNNVSGAAYRGGPGWEQHGVDWGNGTKPIVLWFKSPERAPERFVVFKVPAGKHWQSLHHPSVSHPGAFVVCRLIEDEGDTLRTEDVFQMPVSQKKVEEKI